MKARIIRIGNSQGVRIPNAILEQTGLRDEVGIDVRDNALIIRPATNPRAGWGAAFKKLSERGDDALLDGDTPGLTSWDEDEWEWKS